MVIIEGVAVSLYVFCFLLGWKRNRFILNPLSIFSAIWMVVVLCAFTYWKYTRPKYKKKSIYIQKFKDYK